MDTDVYFHKVVTFRNRKQELKFRTSQELFSAHDIDLGTRFLLRTITEADYPPPQSILDIGCGYGPLGLTLKALYPQSAVHLTDRDALAVEYACQNAELNGFAGVECYGALGYDGVTQTNFDLIVSNIPGKAGEPVITDLLQEARYYLKPNGVAAIVIVTPLKELAEKVLAETPGAEVVLKKERPGHAVFHYRFNTENPPKSELNAFKRGIYHRKTVTIKLDKLFYKMHTAYGLPEFDSLSYDTEILLKTLEDYKNKKFTRVLALNPGQGHVPAVLWRYFRPPSASLAGRDLLALQISKHNLMENGCPEENIRLFHQPGLNIENADRYDLITLVLPEENRAALQSAFEKAAGLIDEKGMMIISGGSTAVTRLLTYLETRTDFIVKNRERRRGYSAAVLEKL